MDELQIFFAGSRSSIVTLPLLLLLFAFSFTMLVKRAYFTSIASIPGPWLSKFTSLPLVLHVIRAQRVQYIHHLHDIYGPVVRIAPNEVDVSDLQGYHSIHRIGRGFPKSQWYPRFRTAFAEQDVFSETDSKKHTIRRKLLSRPFSKTNLRQNWERLVSDKARLAVTKIKTRAEDGVCNIFEWWTYYTVDVIGQISFGESFGMLDLGKKTEFIQMFENFAMIGILRAEIPLLYYLARLIPNFIYDINKDEKTIIRYGREVISQAKEGSVDRTNIFTGFLTANEMGISEISSDSIVVEATGLIGAGGGTTSVTLTYLVWAVLGNSQIQNKLEREVASLSNDFTDSDLEQLPYLNAVIEEALRVYGPIPGGLSRVVSEAGLHTCGYFIPAETIVCTQSYSMHRNPEIYPNPERFDPERFLQKEDTGKEQSAAFAAFGAGSRTCLGVHLAYMELRMAVTLFFRECTGARLALSSPDDMDMVNFFGSVPKGQSCNITLSRD